MENVDQVRTTTMTDMDGNKFEVIAEADGSIDLGKQRTLRVNYLDLGMAYWHNMPCPVYTKEEVAVLDLSQGVIMPSWKAQEEGWRTVKLSLQDKIVRPKSGFGEWVLKHFFDVVSHGRG